ncbi:hypothetical protein OG481_09710 [Streptomyces longwoodensis]|uniref:hypothetical protein n=1 Tax=Streptomyces longwoodensis TaxID=68231 RepID=UPI002DDAA112|nr:hypothetical protein [Streptomyces longwoodensis]WRY88792.1 hypothetical protein OG481_09710 [Streptomyces longwoodensis]
MERTDQPAQQPRPGPGSPPPGRILSEPATVEACRTDYDEAEDVRTRMHAQAALNRR